MFVFLRKSQASDTEEPGKSLFHALKQKLEYRVRYRTSTTYGQLSGEVLIRIFSPVYRLKKLILVPLRYSHLSCDFLLNCFHSSIMFLIKHRVGSVEYTVKKLATLFGALPYFKKF